ncbi:MAG: hypothetical protein JXA58_04260 [Dehalococcoidia bacterium]|nr:hypothetical protein [Dehalococcoidia bacterium]
MIQSYRRGLDLLTPEVKVGNKSSEPEPVLDTRKLEQRMLLYYTQDGLWDLCLGACVLAWALGIRFDLVALHGAFCGAAVVLVWMLKKAITHPRAGYARLREGGRLQRRFTKALAISVVLGLVVFLLGVVVFEGMSGGIATTLRAYFPVLFGAMVAILFSVIAAWVHQPRFYGYALLIFLAGVAHQWGGVALWIAVAAAGMAIVVCGGAVLARFLKNHPKLDENVDA